LATVEHKIREYIITQIKGTGMKYLLFILFILMLIFAAGCTSSAPIPVASPVTTPTPQVIYITVTVTVTPTLQTTPKEMAYLQSVDCGLDPSSQTVYHCKGKVSIKNAMYSFVQVILMYPDGQTYSYDVGGMGGSDATLKPFFTYPDNRYIDDTPRFFVKLGDNQFPVTMSGSEGIAYMNAPSGQPQGAPASIPTYSSPSSSSGSAHLSGSGDDTRSFSVTGGGGFLITGSYSGLHNFIVHIADSRGNIEEFVFNEIGSYSGRKIVNLDAGTHYLEVQASGPWTIDISPA
jgi:hypothetical protein